MRCIIPAAGRGTRLRPHTHTKPKALLSLGNKPIISHILDSIIEAKIQDIIIIVGYEKNQLIDYVMTNYGDLCNFTFIEQKNRKGLGHAIYTAGKFLDGDPILIALGDSLYENSFSQMLEEFNKFPDLIGTLTVKTVPNPQKYGVVITEKDSNLVHQLIEKPQTPISSKAITGIYIIRNSQVLKEALDELISSNQIGSGGELQLTDALQIMVKKGYKIGTIDSGRWFDCGKKEDLLSAHKFVLNKTRESSIMSDLENSIIIPPVAIQSDCSISNSIIGPHVSIEKRCVIERGIISSSIIGADSKIKNASIHESVIGDKVELVGGLSDLNIGDHSKIQFL